MHKNTIFTQLLQLFSGHGFKKIVDQHNGDKYTKRFSCWNQFTALLFAQIKGINSLRDITDSLESYKNRWYHLGIESVARSTLSDANNKRSCEIFEKIFYDFLGKCQELAPKHKFKFRNPLYALDSTTIDLCLNMYPWAKFRKRKGALKIHTLLDQQGCIPSFISMTDGKCHDINIVKDSRFDFPALMPDSIITVDRAYIDYNWLFSLEKQQVSFVVKAKSNINYKNLGQHRPAVNRNIKFDREIELKGFYTRENYPLKLRLIKYYDRERKKFHIFMTNNFKLSAQTIADIYKSRWNIEIFFKWIKQNLKIKSFLGTSKNAVMTQVWVAMIYYLMLAFIKFQTRYSFSMRDLARTVKDLLMDKVSLIEILRKKYDQFYKNIREPSVQLSFW